MLFGRFASAQAGQPVALYLLDLRTKQVSTLPGSEGLWSPRWSLDGQYIAALKAKGPNLILFDFKTHKSEELPTGAVDFFAWSKDGRYIYFDGTEPEAEGAVLRVGLAVVYCESSLL